MSDERIEEIQKRFSQRLGLTNEKGDGEISDHERIENLEKQVAELIAAVAKLIVEEKK